MASIAWTRWNIARSLLIALRDQRLALALGLLAGALVLAAQVPFHYAIEVGQADGPGGDLPLVEGFYPPERDVHGSFRWTSERSIVRLPGVGQRPLLMTLRVFPISNEVAQHGPHAIDLWADGRLLQVLPVRPAGAVYHVLLPPPANRSGDHIFELRSTTFVPAGDQRSIGTPVDQIMVTSLAGLALPAWRSGLIWLLAATVLWLALGSIGFAPPRRLQVLVPAILLVGLASVLDPPRAALGARPALEALVIGWVLVRVMRVAVGNLYNRFAVPFDPQTLRWLLLLSLLVFGLRFGGKLYPESMPGDLGFHANRYADVIRGQVLLLSKNRGVLFPYPSGLYLFLAPFSLLGMSREIQIRLSTAILDAFSPLLVYAIAAGNHGPAGLRTGEQAQGGRPLPRTAAFALAAAGIYSLSASGFMVTWWNFSTHIFTQFAHLLLVGAVVLFWRLHAHQPAGRAAPHPNTRRWLARAGLCCLQLLVYLGHFGFWMNTTLLGGVVLIMLMIAVLRRRADGGVARTLLWGFIAAQVISVGLFYSAYAGLFLGQARAAAAGGLTGLAGRAAIPFNVLWNTLWDAGLRVHFGFFPVPLALSGLLLVWRRAADRERQRAHRSETRGEPAHAVRVSILPALMAGTFLIGICFAVLPFLTGSSLATRWLMFSAWAIAIGAAVAAQRFWRAGLAGRMLVVAIGGYMLWITASQWLAALAWRVRPPEPF